ncbi:hypothetical protein CMO83_05220 [Candidatus Woesearchaeota archaeon]|nr:hypothetical protein [Candidatus Woesearchaeota archaeon]
MHFDLLYLSIFIFIVLITFINLLEFALIMDNKEILEYLYSLESPNIKLGLHNIQEMLDKIGSPEKYLKCIHVAGTNGKGSVCAMMFSALKESGYKVGIYTSPHLKKFNERIRINDKFITDKEIAEYFLKVKPFITNQSFFEITTAMALLYFDDKKVDFAVLEVGLGGRLDATNVVNPLISVITNIALEHTDMLGNKIEKVAYEKAGIIKNKVPVVTDAQGKALQIIKNIAKERNSKVILAKKSKKIAFKYINGNFQQENASVAITALNVLNNTGLIKLKNKKIISGIKKTQIAGRLQFIATNVLVDCAHNPPSFEVLKKELSITRKKRKIRNFIFVVGILKDKDIKTMLKTINPLVSAMIFTKADNKRASEPKNLLNMFRKINKKTKAEIIEDPKKALSYAEKIAGKKDLVVVAGSIYLVGRGI